MLSFQMNSLMRKILPLKTNVSCFKSIQRSITDVIPGAQSRFFFTEGKLNGKASSVLSAASNLRPAETPLNNTAHSLASETTTESNIINATTRQLQELVNQRASRLFAVVMIGGSQFKVTTDDIIMIKNPFYPTIGDKIRIEKVLLVGGKDFTIFGKPLVDKSIVRVEATVIEKTLSNAVIMFTYKPRKDNRKMNFFKGFQTMLRINSITIENPDKISPDQLASGRN